MIQYYIYLFGWYYKLCNGTILIQFSSSLRSIWCTCNMSIYIYINLENKSNMILQFYFKIIAGIYI